MNNTDVWAYAINESRGLVVITSDSQPDAQVSMGYHRQGKTTVNS